MSSCLVCHRTLRKEPSLSRGVGPSCAKKIRGMAGMMGTGGKAFRVLGDEYWERFIAEHAAIRNRHSQWEQSVSSLPAHLEREGSRIVVERIGDYAVYGTKVSNGRELAGLFRDIANSDREKLFVACCDEDDNLIGTQCVSVGSIDASFATPREILKAPFLLGAKKFYVLHNHPSGNPEPSEADYDVTKNIYDASRAFGIEFVGQAIVGDGKYAFLPSDGTHPQMGTLDAPAEKQSVPLYDTSQRSGTIEKVAFRNSQDVTRYAKAEIFRQDKKGVYLICTNTKYETVSVSPFSSDDFSQNTRALVMGNAANCFLVADDGLDREEFVAMAKKFEPVAAVLNARLVDAIQTQGSGGYSLRENLILR